MRALIVEDDRTSRMLLEALLKGHGEVHTAVNGEEGVQAVEAALLARGPFELVCLDIMMPEMDGQEALRKIRALEAKHMIPTARAARIVMTTALADPKNVMEAFREQCDGYLVKPIDKAKLLELLAKLKLIPAT